ncbi:MAG: DUF2442 domain-containing protein [Deltaproteobacteria bacterium]|nr:DUF2442 domain-containing protein [Deltaproteobacteria bacterium]MBI4374412.1 DUF2442 domain-containing protein [Deltaproteobacteria bacterium]
MCYIKEATYIKDYRLKINFGDDTQKEVDLFPYLDGEVFEPLKNIAYFKQVQVNQDIDTIFWDNGADFSPEFLYKIGKPIQS